MTAPPHLTPDALLHLCELAREAGRAILDVYHRGGAHWTKDDHSPLTEADLRADAVIRTGLQTQFPGDYIWSEESASAGPRAADRFFLVDPLDGTKEFLSRSGEFTVNIALIEHGAAVAGVVYAPVQDELFYAVAGQGAWKRSADRPAQPIHTAPHAPGEPLRVLGSRSHGTAELAVWLHRLDQPYTFVAAGSSLKFCRIAEGKADVYPRFGPTSQWDTAAPQCILEAAGGSVKQLEDGQPLRYGLQRPVINPSFVAAAHP